MDVPQTDIDILRRLAGEVAQIAALPVHKEKARLWQRLNDLDSVRPMVWINEICWNEMNVDDELTCRCTSSWGQGQEWNLRTLLYQWRHMPGDMVVDDYLACPLAVWDAGFGLSEDVTITRLDPSSAVVSRTFHPQIRDPEDIHKIKCHPVRYDLEATEANYQRMCRVYEGIMPVRKVGIKGTWFAPWDELIRWWGVQEAMTDMVLRPKMVSDIMSHLVDCYIGRLDNWEALNVLDRNDDSSRIGSGGYGYVSDLPGAGFDSGFVHPKNMWGCATAQIFSEVSPEMHWEFALRHEMRWLERWGLSYYGCCEPLDIKMDILRKIPNLRKISMSHWIHVDRAVAQVQDKYVFSRKPTPALLAEDNWHGDRVRKDLVDCLELARPCHVEVILKDISTVRYKPQRLWEWEKIAMEVVQQFAK
ncbi:MAG: hypothetical protein NTV86_05935 [Planctomycetota bacterium]|nr:hypothetical protein [Planctomycetota bacterium]